jgi:methyl-accepting chemotaxis protein
MSPEDGTTPQVPALRNATNEISRSAQLASTGTGDVSRNIEEVTKAAGAAGKTAEGVLATAAELSGHSGAPTAEVAKFLQTVRAA